MSYPLTHHLHAEQTLLPLQQLLHSIVLAVLLALCLLRVEQTHNAILQLNPLLEDALQRDYTFQLLLALIFEFMGGYGLRGCQPGSL